jgi:two-component system, OmpR family, sensor kinase
LPFFMKISFFNRLYVRLWLAVLAAVLVLTLLMGWFFKTQADRIRAERLAEAPAREVTLRNAAGEVLGQTSVRPVRVPGRGVELQLQLPPGVQGGDQVSIAIAPRPLGGERGLERGPDRGMSRGAEPSSLARFIFNPTHPEAAPWHLGLSLTLFALAVALGSYPVVRRLTKRLENLQGGVERLGAGDLKARVAVEGADETAFLAQRFNAAADRIEALVQSQKSLLANASHELRSPLARIRMGLELLQGAPSERLSAEMARNISELDALVDEILLASRLESAASGHASAWVKEPVDLLGLAAEECARLHVPLDVTQEAGASSEIAGEAKLLRRLLRNLLENGLRYGTATGENSNLEQKTVSAVVNIKKFAIEIVVNDRGPGVPALERERIFEPFYRSAHASEASGGVGLGLALVKSIAQQHGGQVACLDALPPATQGARFVVTLPRTV